ncbi:hypothetical protein [Swingsia samuiensis]|uniref:hypothetical protein n=1 Tax=Swingsia samuiensis TaxID=1293412 RepID=UPI0038D13C12
MGGYDNIVYVDILIGNPAHREIVRSSLKKIHVPGEETENGFRVYGYVNPGQSHDYI